ncbi:Hypothetical protein I5071_35820 [Sandaracinus amylolyticus]|nr:Hypothetical protein I5071_35820 [Sandaracinus amylolyticus]
MSAALASSSSPSNVSSAQSANRELRSAPAATRRKVSPASWASRSNVRTPYDAGSLAWVSHGSRDRRAFDHAAKCVASADVARAITVHVTEDRRRPEAGGVVVQLVSRGGTRADGINRPTITIVSLSGLWDSNPRHSAWEASARSQFCAFPGVSCRRGASDMGQQSARRSRLPGSEPGIPDDAGIEVGLLTRAPRPRPSASSGITKNARARSASFDRAQRGSSIAAANRVWSTTNKSACHRTSARCQAGTGSLGS